MAVAVVANGVGGAFAITGNRLPHKETLSAFATSAILGYPKVPESGDEFPVCHGLCGIKPGFLQVNGIGKGEGGLPRVNRDRQSLVRTAGKERAPYLHGGGAEEMLTVVMRQGILDMSGNDVRDGLLDCLGGRSDFHKVKLQTMRLVAVIGRLEQDIKMERRFHAGVSSIVFRGLQRDRHTLPCRARPSLPRKRQAARVYPPLAQASSQDRQQGDSYFSCVHHVGKFHDK